MPGTAGPRLGFVWGYSPGETGWGVGAFNPNFAKLEALLHLTVISIANTPPGSPANGDCYIIDTAPTGTWAGHAKAVAVYYTTGGWVYYAPVVGLRAFNRASITYWRYSGTAWDEEAIGDVSGPGSAVDGNVPLFDGSTGDILRDSGKQLPSGVVVGDVDTQMLFNKTIDGNDNSLVVHLDSDVVGDLDPSHLNGGTGASATTAWFGDGTWKTVIALTSFDPGEVLGNASGASAPAARYDIEVVWRSSVGDGLAGQVWTSNGPGVAGSWEDPGAATMPTLASAEVLGNPGGSPATATGTDAEVMLRSSIGDGTAGQVYTSGGPGVAGAWEDPAAVAKRYEIGCFVPGTMTASQVLLVHVFSGSVTIPADGGTYDSHSSKARGTAAATGSWVAKIQKATAAAPTTFSDVGTITVSAAGITGAYLTSGSPLSFAAGDTLQLVAPASADATFAGFSATIVGQA